MKLAAFAAVVVTSFTTAIAQRPCEPWQQPYTGADATGKHVIACWQFAAGNETNDSSANKLHLKLQGAVIAKDGKFGPCLESFCGHPVTDKKHAAVAAHHSALTPKGAFTIEMWIKPKKELDGYPDAFLLDKKYVAHSDYQMILTAADKGGSRRLAVNLGFGDESDRWTSEPAKYEAGAWYHVAFTYDGAGDGRFWRDGSALGGAKKPGRAAITPGKHPLSIGDRHGSYYHGFPGFIAQVRLCNGVLEFRPAAFAVASDRTSFVRMEKAVPIRFNVTNLQRTKLKGATAVVSLEGLGGKNYALPELDGGASHTLTYTLDTSLRPGEYNLRARLQIPGNAHRNGPGSAGILPAKSSPSESDTVLRGPSVNPSPAGKMPALPGAYVSEESFPVVIVARPLPKRMPVLMWGIGGTDHVIKELPRLKQIGFTHCLGMGTDFGAIFEAGKPTVVSKPETVAETKRMLNLALANDLGICVSLSPGNWAEHKKEFLRIDRQGKSNLQRPSICGLFPEMQKLSYNVGASVAQTYGEFPAWQAALLHTEVRDGAGLCYHDHDRAACRQATGADIPAEIGGKWGVDRAKLKDFPADCVVRDDDPIYRYCQWYWKVGDGWNGLNNELHRGLKSTGRNDLWTFHDPAVRVASVYGSGGAVDFISQWTYSYPDPIRIGVATDELFAMARGAKQPQQVMKMTQIIWYRNQTTPARKGDEVTKAVKSVFEDTDPDRIFPTIAPMHLREAFWTKMARPIQGIMYHGWQSLVPVEGSTSAYRYTHPQTQHELRRLVKEVVEPLGPALMQVPDRKSDVAYLESFASQMFARRGTYGWCHTWCGDAYQMLMWAQLQPEIVYDETVVERGLDGFRVLVMFDCDVLTATVAAKVKEFQKKGGLIVGDERLCPAIKADIVIQSYTRTRKADEDRAALVAKAGELRKALDKRYHRYSDSSNADVVARCRAFGKTDYLFAINDKREFGTYVGQHGLVMEDGLPSETTLSLARKSGFVYNLIAGQPVSATTSRGQLRIPAALGPCEGRVFMVTDRAIAGVKIEAPDAAKLGDAATVNIAIVDKAGRPLDAVVPLRVDIRDSAGRDAERTGYYGAKDGRLELKLDLAANDSPGVWQIRARELASGQTAATHLRVTRP
ncbi:MAG: hypothetical protein A2107_11085 [Verrucomicrobia bacterium GWF2_62_7]|nr:MAG: hypothetical protein A2107_11085 [Verrucomicrobia bacterium GWF2_62_7]